MLGNFQPAGIEYLRFLPEILLSGDHGKIRAWREAEAMRRTTRRRPELVAGKRKS